MSSMKPGELNPIGLWRASKHLEIARLFPFTRRRSRWLSFGHTWTDVDRLRIYHALTPFRESGELAEASRVILVASKRWNARSPRAIERLLVALRYLDSAKRIEAYGDPEAWLARLGSLTAASALALAQAATERAIESRAA